MALCCAKIWSRIFRVWIECSRNAMVTISTLAANISTNWPLQFCKSALPNWQRSLSCLILFKPTVLVRQTWKLNCGPQVDHSLDHNLVDIDIIQSQFGHYSFANHHCPTGRDLDHVWSCLSIRYWSAKLENCTVGGPQVNRSLDHDLVDNGRYNPVSIWPQK